MDEAFSLVWVLLLVLVVVTIFAGTKTVPQGQIWTVERFGAFTRELHPGLNFLIPYIDRIGRLKNCVAYGPGILDLAHQPDEYVAVEDLLDAARVMAIALADLLGADAE